MYKMYNMYKILFGLIDIDFNHYFTFEPNETTRGGSGHN